MLELNTSIWKKVLLTATTVTLFCFCCTAQEPFGDEATDPVRLFERGQSAHARGESVGAVGEVDDVHQRHQPEQGQRTAGVAEVDVTEERECDRGDRDVGEHHDQRGAGLAEQLDHGRQVDGELAPTSELDLHLGVYRRYDAGAVVHTHAPMATALSCVLDGELPCVHYQMLLLGGAVRVAPYATFGTPELAESVLDALDGRTAALMANHGAITHAADLDGAVDLSLLLEWACTVYWRAATLGAPRTLDEDQRQAVVEAAIGRGYGKTKRVGEEP